MSKPTIKQIEEARKILSDAGELIQEDNFLVQKHPDILNVWVLYGKCRGCGDWVSGYIEFCKLESHLIQIIEAKEMCHGCVNPEYCG